MIALCVACLLTQDAYRVVAQTPVPTAPAPQTIVLDAKAPTTPFPHFWGQTFGSGRTILSLRASYRNDMRAVRGITNFQSVRFHGILNDEVGLYDPARQQIIFAQMRAEGKPATDASPYIFSYVDQIYDGLQELGVKPFVELSFMPKKLATDPNSSHPFWYKPNVSPPKDYAAWDAMITALARHLLSRYGIEEVATWKFEVWNEPNLDFWGGAPKQATYFELCDHTARALKAASPRIQVPQPEGEEARFCTARPLPRDRTDR